jgi:hypothetical protein
MIFGIPLEILTILIGTISLLALFRPEWNSAYKRIKSDIEIYPPEGVEFSFAGFGPQITVNGTLRALYCDHYISDMRAIIKKNGADEETLFPWRIFQSPEVVIDFSSRRQKEIEITTAAPFSLKTGSPAKISVIFTDNNEIVKLKELAASTREKWQAYISLPQVQKTIRELQNDPKLVLNQNILFEAFAQRLRKNNEFCLDNLRSKLESLIFWEPGEYHVRLSTSTNRPTREIEFSFIFEISPEQVDRLNFNANKLAMDICGITVELNREWSKIFEFQRDR